jgi:precorrin-6Y C5,15-methyltransferase (decarboxylating)
MTAQPRIWIIGVGSDGLSGLTSRARDLLLSAEVVFGSDRVLGLLPELPGEHRPLGSDLQETTEELRALIGKKRLAVVAGGDPCFTAWRVSCAIDWGRRRLKSCRTFRACSSPSPASRRRGRRPT